MRVSHYLRASQLRLRTLRWGTGNEESSSSSSFFVVFVSCFCWLCSGAPAHQASPGSEFQDGFTAWSPARAEALFAPSPSARSGQALVGRHQCRGWLAMVGAPAKEGASEVVKVSVVDGMYWLRAAWGERAGCGWFCVCTESWLLAIGYWLLGSSSQPGSGQAQKTQSKPTTIHGPCPELRMLLIEEILR